MAKVAIDKSEFLRRECSSIDDSFWTKLLARPEFVGNGAKHDHKCIQCGCVLECFDHYCETSFVNYSLQKRCADCSNTLAGHEKFTYTVDNGEYAEVLAKRIRIANRILKRERLGKIQA